MAGGERKNWRELASAALDAKDPDKLLEIVQELNKGGSESEQVFSLNQTVGIEDVRRNSGTSTDCEAGGR